MNQLFPLTRGAGKTIVSGLLYLQLAVIIGCYLVVPTIAYGATDGLVVFYRPKRFIGSGLTPSVYVDGQQVARLDNGRYFSLPLSPGKHEITSSMKHAPLVIDVRNNDTVYLEMIILAGNWRGGGRFIPAPSKDAIAVIKKIKPLDRKWIFDQRVNFVVQTEADRNEEAARSGTITSEAMLDIASSPTNADIQIDGRFAGSTPSSVGVVGGEHTIRLTKKGFTTWERKVTTTTGHVNLVAELETITAGNGQETATTGIRNDAMTEASVSIISIPDGAQIFIDSVGYGRAPAILKLSQGSHSLQLVKEGYRDFVQNLDVNTNSPVKITGELQR